MISYHSLISQVSGSILSLVDSSGLSCLHFQVEVSRLGGKYGNCTENDSTEKSEYYPGNYTQKVEFLTINLL